MSFRAILSTSQSVTAVAVACRIGCAAAMHDSPTNSPAPSRAMVASLPRLETTVSFSRPFWT